MTYDSVLAALADPTRRRILEHLRDAACPVARLAERLPVSRPAVSQHLKVLQEAGLVSVRAEGAARIYSARPEGLMPLRRYLEDHWGAALDAFAAEVRRQRREDGDERPIDPDD